MANNKMKINYIGKMMDSCENIEICRVVDFDAATGATLVYNRTSEKMDIVHVLDRYELSEKAQKDIRNSEKMYTMPNVAGLLKDGAWKLFI